MVICVWYSTHTCSQRSYVALTEAWPVLVVEWVVWCGVGGNLYMMARCLVIVVTWKSSSWHSKSELFVCLCRLIMLAGVIWIMFDVIISVGRLFSLELLDSKSYLNFITFQNTSALNKLVL